MILSVREDVLGSYGLERGRPSIILYWAVIGLVSRWIGCKFEDLSIVVLIHELAHAITQAGCDIQGQRWNLDFYFRADIEVTEGLATVLYASCITKI